MTGKTEGANKARRDFLKLAGTAAPAAALAVTSAGSQANAAPADPDLSSDKMQDTAHTRAYYASARF
ncbi:twin-arginine translocation pathway signal protein [Salipiger aestuarii]|uniref:Secreted protein n=1 Tax=Salipiger aestuarii TaxID=568098 RepID=A0A327YHJ3_9RHOB|nr:twin-arginine translocation signal domain-containing protein [Salipiger aestuarii]KAA8608879.1 twin-arginine translocation pathway signal protein [Salipiger aestuarii]KAA8613183.1 twin-arginine translocation pathway signal protein [Salipiger aestuarii]KAB2543065.1 twin-arginine translocation pathway signal protein [Salipiger aestuarii]RAK19666.1 secreted protein [Salipiger aestuarii]